MASEIVPQSETTSDDPRELFDELPEELRIEILRRLEPKSATEAARVSKSWLRLFAAHCVPRTAPFGLPFAGELFLGPTTPQGFLAVKFLNEYKVMPIVKVFRNGRSLFPPGVDFTKSFVDACNGLILFCHSDDDNKAAAEAEAKKTLYCYYVFNSFIGQCARVAKPFFPEERSYASLAYDPSRSSFFRIVQFGCFLGESACVGMYCSETRAWKKVRYSLDEEIAAAMWMEQSFFLGGAIYRLSMSGHLLRFEVGDEVDFCAQAKAIELPNKAVSKDFSRGCVGVSENRIHFMAFDEESRLRIWALMAKNGCEWTLQRVIERLHDHREFEGNFIKPLGFHPSSSFAFLGANSKDLGSSVICIRFGNDKDGYHGPFEYVDHNVLTWNENWSNVLAFPSLYCHVPFATGFE